jgi:two-component system response regulator YesN
MYNVLIIDDKEVFRRKIKRMNYFQMNQDKFRIQYEAQNGVEALEIIKNNKVDVIVTDIRMPLVDGIELLKIINTEKLCKCVILLSEYASFDYAKEGILNGAFDYVLKPIDDNKIKETFQRAYNHLTTVNGNIKIELKYINILVDSILNDEENLSLHYANYIAKKIINSSSSYDERLVQMNDILANLGEICEKKTYIFETICSH